LILDLKNIVNKKDKVDFSTIDDVAIGKFVMNEMPEIKMKPIFDNIPDNGFYSVPNFNADKDKIRNFIENNKIIFFRNRNDEDRNIDPKQIDIIIEILMENKTNGKQN
jgi:hypothetical protein